MDLVVPGLGVIRNVAAFHPQPFSGKPKIKAKARINLVGRYYRDHGYRMRVARRITETLREKGLLDT